MNVSKKKKMLLVGPTNGSVHVKNYYNLVKDYFDDVLVVTMQPIDFCKFEIADFSIKNPFSIRGKVLRIRKIIKDFNPDVIHIHQASSCSFLTAKANKFNIPIVLTCWGSDVLLVPQMGWTYRYIIKYAMSRAKFLTACSHNMAETIAGLGEMKPVVVANFGIEYDGNLVIPKKDNVIYSNRMHADIYRIEEIILGAAEFLKSNSDWKLIIAATGENTEKLKSMAVDHISSELYEFIGFVDAQENRRQYLRARIWISIPESDGTSISLYEAMGYGCIPVVSDIPGNKECISDGVNGVLVKDNIKDSFERAINLSLHDVQNLNRDIVIKRATKEVNRKLFCQIYDSIFAEKQNLS